MVVEYKRQQDQNVINQGLDYLAWLDDHQAEFRELVRKRLGDRRVTDIDFGASRLLCIAEGFLRQDQAAAENSRRPIELLRYRRYGDAYVALELVYGAAPEPVSQPPDPRPNHVVGEDPDYSIYEPWRKTSEASRTLFRELKTLVESFGSVRTTAFKTEMTFQCMAAPGTRKPVVAFVRLRVRSALRVIINEKYLSAIPLEDGFTHLVDHDKSLVIAIRDREHIRRAEPLLRAAYDNLLKHGHAAARRGSKEEFLESCDDYGKAVLSRILDLADRQSMSIRLGTKGFTLGIDFDGTRVVVCYAYSPGGMYQQSLYTALRDQRGFRKMRAPAAAEQLHEEARRTGLFAPAGKELKCLIDRAFTDDELDTLVAWCESVAQAIREHARPGSSGSSPRG